MILEPNHIISITRGATYSTTVVSSLKVYIYENNDEQDAINGVEGGQDEMRLLTVYSGIQVGDKITDEVGNVYIVKKVKYRNSRVAKFYEIQIRIQND